MTNLTPPILDFGAATPVENDLLSSAPVGVNEAGARTAFEEIFKEIIKGQSSGIPERSSLDRETTQGRERGEAKPRETRALFATSTGYRILNKDENLPAKDRNGIEERRESLEGGASNFRNGPGASGQFTGREFGTGSETSKDIVSTLNRRSEEDGEETPKGTSSPKKSDRGAERSMRIELSSSSDAPDIAVSVQVQPERNPHRRKDAPEPKAVGESSQPETVTLGQVSRREFVRLTGVSSQLQDAVEQLASYIVAHREEGAEIQSENSLKVVPANVENDEPTEPNRAGAILFEKDEKRVSRNDGGERLQVGTEKIQVPNPSEPRNLSDARKLEPVLDRQETKTRKNVTKSEKTFRNESFFPVPEVKRDKVSAVLRPKEVFSVPFESAPIAPKESSPVALGEKAPTLSNDPPKVVLEKGVTIVPKEFPSVALEKGASTAPKETLSVVPEKGAPIASKESLPGVLEKSTPNVSHEKSPVSLEKDVEVTPNENSPVSLGKNTPVVADENQPVAMEKGVTVTSNEPPSVTLQKDVTVTRSENPPIAEHRGIEKDHSERFSPKTARSEFPKQTESETPQSYRVAIPADRPEIVDETPKAEKVAVKGNVSIPVETAESSKTENQTEARNNFVPTEREQPATPNEKTRFFTKERVFEGLANSVHPKEAVHQTAKVQTNLAEPEMSNESARDVQPTNTPKDFTPDSLSDAKTLRTEIPERETLHRYMPEVSEAKEVARRQPSGAHDVQIPNWQPETIEAVRTFDRAAARQEISATGAKPETVLNVETAVKSETSMKAEAVAKPETAMEVETVERVETVAKTEIGANPEAMWSETGSKSVPKTEVKKPENVNESEDGRHVRMFSKRFESAGNVRRVEDTPRSFQPQRIEVDSGSEPKKESPAQVPIVEEGNRSFSGNDGVVTQEISPNKQDFQGVPRQVTKRTPAVSVEVAPKESQSAPKKNVNYEIPHSEHKTGVVPRHTDAGVVVEEPSFVDEPPASEFFEAMAEADVVRNVQETTTTENVEPRQVAVGDIKTPRIPLTEQTAPHQVVQNRVESQKVVTPEAAALEEIPATPHQVVQNRVESQKVVTPEAAALEEIPATPHQVVQNRVESQKVVTPEAAALEEIPATPHQVVQNRVESQKVVTPVAAALEEVPATPHQVVQNRVESQKVVTPEAAALEEVPATPRQVVQNRVESQKVVTPEVAVPEEVPATPYKVMQNRVESQKVVTPVADAPEEIPATPHQVVQNRTESHKFVTPVAAAPEEVPAMPRQVVQNRVESQKVVTPVAAALEEIPATPHQVVQNRVESQKVVTPEVAVPEEVPATPYKVMQNRVESHNVVTPVADAPEEVPATPHQVVTPEADVPEEVPVTPRKVVQNRVEPHKVMTPVAAAPEEVPATPRQVVRDIRKPFFVAGIGNLNDIATNEVEPQMERPLIHAVSAVQAHLPEEETLSHSVESVHITQPSKVVVQGGESPENPVKFAQQPGIVTRGNPETPEPNLINDTETTTHQGTVHNTEQVETNKDTARPLDGMVASVHSEGRAFRNVESFKTPQHTLHEPQRDANTPSKGRESIGQAAAIGVGSDTAESEEAMADKRKQPEKPVQGVGQDTQTEEREVSKSQVSTLRRISKVGESDEYSISGSTGMDVWADELDDELEELVRTSETPKKHEKSDAFSKKATGDGSKENAPERVAWSGWTPKTRTRIIEEIGQGRSNPLGLDLESVGVRPEDIETPNEETIFHGRVLSETVEIAVPKENQAPDSEVSFPKTGKPTEGKHIHFDRTPESGEVYEFVPENEQRASKTSDKVEFVRPETPVRTPFVAQNPKNAEVLVDHKTVSTTTDDSSLWDVFDDSGVNTVFGTINIDDLEDEEPAGKINAETPDRFVSQSDKASHPFADEKKVETGNARRIVIERNRTDAPHHTPKDTRQPILDKVESAVKEATLLNEQETPHQVARGPLFGESGADVEHRIEITVPESHVGVTDDPEVSHPEVSATKSTKSGFFGSEDVPKAKTPMETEGGLKRSSNEPAKAIEIEQIHETLRHDAPKSLFSGVETNPHESHVRAPVEVSEKEIPREIEEFEESIKIEGRPSRTESKRQEPERVSLHGDGRALHTPAVIQGEKVEAVQGQVIAEENSPARRPSIRETIERIVSNPDPLGLRQATKEEKASEVGENKPRVTFGKSVDFTSANMDDSSQERATPQKMADFEPRTVETRFERRNHVEKPVRDAFVETPEPETSEDTPEKEPRISRMKEAETPVLRKVPGERADTGAVSERKVSISERSGKSSRVGTLGPSFSSEIMNERKAPVPPGSASASNWTLLKEESGSTELRPQQKVIETPRERPVESLDEPTRIEAPGFDRPSDEWIIPDEEGNIATGSVNVKEVRSALEGQAPAFSAAKPSPSEFRPYETQNEGSEAVELGETDDAATSSAFDESGESGMAFSDDGDSRQDAESEHSAKNEKAFAVAVAQPMQNQPVIKGIQEVSGVRSHVRGLAVEAVERVRQAEQFNPTQRLTITLPDDQGAPIRMILAPDRANPRTHSVTFVVAEQATQEAIKQIIPEIRTMLTELSLKTSDISIVAHSSHQAGNYEARQTLAAATTTEQKTEKERIRKNSGSKK